MNPYNYIPISGSQPPSGCCVLKLSLSCSLQMKLLHPAAFGLLCVETLVTFLRNVLIIPAAFGLLCVETY